MYVRNLWQHNRLIEGVKYHGMKISWLEKIVTWKFHELKMRFCPSKNFILSRTPSAWEIVNSVEIYYGFRTVTVHVCLGGEQNFWSIHWPNEYNVQPTQDPKWLVGKEVLCSGLTLCILKLVFWWMAQILRCDVRCMCQDHNPCGRPRFQVHECQEGVVVCSDENYNHELKY